MKEFMINFGSYREECDSIEEVEKVVQIYEEEHEDTQYYITGLDEEGEY